jgi:hypothetical protein
MVLTHLALLIQGELTLYVCVLTVCWGTREIRFYFVWAGPCMTVQRGAPAPR